jgi:hypothetical protein
MMKIPTILFRPVNGFLMNLQNGNSKEMENHSVFELEKGTAKNILMVSLNTK